MFIWVAYHASVFRNFQFADFTGPRQFDWMNRRHCNLLEATGLAKQDSEKQGLEAADTDQAEVEIGKQEFISREDREVARRICVCGKRHEMVLTATTDILFTDEPGIDALRDVTARAFGVDPVDVAVGPLLELTPAPGSQVILQRQPEDVPGDFPVWYGLAVDASLVGRVTRAIDTMAYGLGITAISDAADDVDMTLHLPDGSGRAVHLEQGDDDACRITPEMRQLIDRATRRAPGAGNSPRIRPKPSTSGKQSPPKVDARGAGRATSSSRVTATPYT